MTNVKESIFKEMVSQIISNRVFRGIAVKQLNKYLYSTIMNMDNELLKEEKMDQYAFSVSIVNQAKK